MTEDSILKDKKQVTWRAIGDVMGAPILIIATQKAGFATLALEVGFDGWMILLCTVGIWGRPGQVVMAEYQAAGAGLFAIVLASSMANARFLPMCVSFLPLVRDGVKSTGFMILMGQMLSLNSWASCQRQFPTIAPEHRRHYFLVFASILISFAVIGALAGIWAAGDMPVWAYTALLMVNPIFFALVFLGMKGRMVVTALVIGAVLGPVLHMITPEWGLLFAGVGGGTLAFVLLRRWERNKAQ